MAAKTPLIASNIPALREVAGEAAIFADPKNVDAWSGALECIASERGTRAEFIQRGLLQLEKYAWEKCANETLDVLRSVVE
jgi:glycosyltransferase involved in cell wall biosynthesis